MYLSDCLLAGSGTDWLTVNLSSRCTAEGNRISFWSGLLAPVVDALSEEKVPSPPRHLMAMWIRDAWELISWRQQSLRPNLQLESPFPWPLLSMCSCLRGNTHPRKSGTLSLLLSILDMHLCRQAWSFCGSHALVFALLFCVARLLSSNPGGGGGGRGNRHLGWFPCGCEGTVAPSQLLDKGGCGILFFL